MTGPRLFPYDYMIKAVILGDKGVGKTAIISRFTEKEFTSPFKEEKIMDIENKRVNFQVWDAPANDTDKICRTELVYVVYDVTNAQSFTKAEEIVRSIDKNSFPECKEVILIGNLINKRFAISFHGCFFLYYKMDAAIL